MEKEPVAIVKVCDFLGDIVGCGHNVRRGHPGSSDNRDQGKGRGLMDISMEWAEDEAWGGSVGVAVTFWRRWLLREVGSAQCRALGC